MDSSRKHFQSSSSGQNGEPKKRVALFGGSFNPPHEGHFAMLEHIMHSLGVDSIWMMFSQNRFKDADSYASIEQRMEMARLLKDHYPDLSVELSDIEEQLGTHITADILKHLAKAHPDIEFIWVMGGDNLAEFHLWQDYEYIMDHFEICVVNRPGYEDEALGSVVATDYAASKKEPQEILAGGKRGWSFIKTTGTDMSSSGLMKQIHAGQRDFDGPFQDVADYIYRNGLYGVKPELAPDKSKMFKPK